MASGPITSWHIEREKVEAVRDFIFLGSKITVAIDCSHEIKRCLLLGRKPTINLDSKLKSRHHFAGKVYTVKAMVFSVVMYGCESWTIKKVERQKMDAFTIVVLEKTPQSLLDCKKIKPDNPKGNQP